MIVEERENKAPEDAAAGLEALRAGCAKCERCPLGATRTKSVFGTGSPSAKLMFVGEAPGEQEDLSGTPFVGRAGQLLDMYLYAVDIKREDVYIANILKCRPPKNRDPLPAEEDACMDWLRGQVKLIRPKIIVCLGRIAAMRLISPDYRISQQHGQWIEKGAFLMTAVFHPAALLRDPRKKADMMEDMKKIAAKLAEE
ncbi:MAG: uracil-DNA glycosylase [Clostridia bacterium]|nr:uracil-DNA glycosylase [Clostridia bacterium]